MKTKEEILAQKTDWVSEQPFSKLKANVLEAMQLYSDQQNKELREKLISETNRANELRDRLKQEHDDLVNERANGRIEWERLRMEDKAEIQRLTNEVELLKLESDIAFKKVNDKKAEITRLRELLERAKTYVTAKQLYTKIDNELNHKYNPPYIEGKTDLQNEG